MLSLLPRLPAGILRTSALRKAKTARTGPWWMGNIGEWCTVAGGTLVASGVGWSGTSPGGSGNYAEVIDAWGGGIVNTTGIYDGATFRSGTFLVYWGGGHGDYYGNEIYCFGPLENDTPAWYRPRDLTVPGLNNSNEDGSGNPVARHSYQSIVYDVTNNHMIAIGGVARASDAGGVGLTHRYDFDQISPNSNQPWGKFSNPSAASVACIDTTTGIVWSRPESQNAVQTYTVATDTYASGAFKSPVWGTGDATSAIDTSRGIWAIVWNNGIKFYRLNNGTGNDYYTPDTTGSTGPTGDRGIVYDPVADRFVVWNNNGKQLFFLTAPASSPYEEGNPWVWTNTTPSAGSTPDADATSGGSFGRFAYVSFSGVRGYILRNSAAGEAYFYRAA